MNQGDSEATSPGLLTAAEAAERLGVKRETIYAYKSRGLLRAQPTGRAGREGGGQFEPADVDALRQGRRGPASAADDRPTTALTLIEDDAVYYRGLPIEEVAGRHSFEQTASWLIEADWGEERTWLADPAATSVARQTLGSIPTGALPLDQIRVAVSAAAVADPMRFEISPAAWIITGRRLIATVVESLPLIGEDPGEAGATTPSLAARLWPRLTAQPADPVGIALLDAALVVHADHEFGSSTMAARIAAGVGADPYSVVLAGLTCYGSGSHSGDSLRVEDLLASSAAYSDPAVALGSVLRPYGTCPGFGSAVHPPGDPRATFLLDALERTEAPRAETVMRLAESATARGLGSPNKDFGLGGLAFTYNMIHGASEAIFAIARMAGWLAHGLEARSTGLTRAHARYTGVAPRR